MTRYQNSYLKAITILVSAIALVSADALEEPPTSGKFFYAQLYEQDYQLFTKMIIGDSRPNHLPQELQLFPTTQEFTFAIFSIFCTLQDEHKQCKVPSSYNHNHDNGEKRKTVGLATERAFIYQDGGIEQIVMMGEEIQTDANFTVPSFLRQTTMDDLYMLSIHQLEKTYSSRLMSGYLGLGPYTGIDELESNHLTIDEAFLFELKQKHHVDHQTFAFYVSSDPAEPSMIKFGSYDPEGFENPDDMGIFRTAGLRSWAIKAAGTLTLKKSNGQSLTADFHEGGFLTGNFLIDPSLPFFYVPATYFKKIIDTFANGQVTFQGAEFSEDKIKWNCGCYQVDPGVTTDLRFTAEAHDGQNKEFFFNLVDLLVDGSIFGETDTCYLGIFKNTNAHYPAMMYAGAIFLKKYYTFFDMSGLQTQGVFLLGQKLRVGIGLRNPNNYILSKQYDHFFESYAPNLYDQSVYTYEPNKYNYKVDDPSDPSHPDFKKNKSNTVVTIIVVFGLLILAILAGLFVLRYREQKKKQSGYLALSNFGEAMRPSEMGDSTTNINYSLNEDTPNDTKGEKQPYLSINKSDATLMASSASMQVSQDI